MQRDLTETSKQDPQTADALSHTPTPQHGLSDPLPSASDNVGDRPEYGPAAAASPRALVDASGSEGASAALAAVIAVGAVGALDRRRLSLNNADLDTDPRAAAGGSESPASIAGRRISEYENALIRASSRRARKQAFGFKVIKHRAGSPSTGLQLTDFPNVIACLARNKLTVSDPEILTHILSHLHPDSHGAVALVSKRFYGLVTTPYAWRTAFLRYFPGQDALTVSASSKATAGRDDNEMDDAEDRVRSEFRYFSRLTALASWRSEYLLRTRLLRSVARGKPSAGSGGIGSSLRSSQSGKRANAVLTYNSKLPWVITNLHAVFSSSNKKGPRVVHGAADLGVCSMSDPTVGRVEKWGLDDPFSFVQLDEAFPNLELYGVGDGPAAVPNVMDVSQPYGMLGGEGFPGGRVYYRAPDQSRGRYLGHESAIIDMAPEIPKIPELSEAVTSVWIAKSAAVPSQTHSMVGIMTGSSLGVVTTYALGHDSTGPRYTGGDMTARWILSPGVPIVALKVDDNYSLRRRLLRRVWAVALNALGEVYYLTETPTPPVVRAKGEDAIKDAWHAGRTVYWELIESTRRAARPDEFDKNAIRGAYSPRSPSDAMRLSKEQTVAEAQEIEKFLRHKPSHFRKVCKGWDMRRMLEVDFASGGVEDTAGESIFVIARGQDRDESEGEGEGEPAGISRYTRQSNVLGPEQTGVVTPTPTPATSQPQVVPSSIFGGLDSQEQNALAVEQQAKEAVILPVPGTPELGTALPAEEIVEEWRVVKLDLKNYAAAGITSSSMDATTYAVMAPFEDPLQQMGSQGGANTTKSNTPTSKNATGEIPGRRSRLLAVGTDCGAVIVWNAREKASAVAPLNPTRVIQTESPSISCLAVSALYLVHGGSDGLVQAWDPLASSLEPIRTLNSKSPGRVPRHIVNANPALRHADFSAAGAIFLDPDPSTLRGVLAFGTFVRFWTYSSTAGQGAGRKRRLRHTDPHGRLASRRQGGVSSYIAAEAAELRREQAHQAREQARLRNRFGVGLGDLTEEEAVRYAQLISEEAFAADEARRLSASASPSDDTGSSLADLGETASSAGSSSSSFASAETVTPEPSLSGAASLSLSPPVASTPGSGALPTLHEEETATDDDDYEAQIQRALRLSLLEGVNDLGESPRVRHDPGGATDGFAFPVKVKKSKRKGNGSNGSGRQKGSGSSSPITEASEAHTPVGMATQIQGQSQHGESSSHGAGPGWSLIDGDEDAELELALRLSLEEERSRQERLAAAEDPDGVAVGFGLGLGLGLGLELGLGARVPQVDEEFPVLEVQGKGKGKQL